MGQSKSNDTRGNRIVVGLVPARYDHVAITYPDSVTEVYTFWDCFGQPDAVIVGVVTLVYTSSSKDDLLSATRNS